MVRPGKEPVGQPGVSVIRADLDAATSVGSDVHEAQWRSGVHRQAHPDAASHQRAASAAAATKRKAGSMAVEEKDAAERRRADRRNEGKREITYISHTVEIYTACTHDSLATAHAR